MFDLFLTDIEHRVVKILSQNFETKVVIGTKSNQLNVFLQLNGIVEQSLRHRFITSSRPRAHFFNKTDFEQNCFKTAF